MMNRTKKRRFILLTILFMGLMVGYALLSENLRIVGFTQLADSKWDIHFENVVINEDSVDLGANDKAAAIDSDDDTLVEYEVTLKQPGDFYEFTVDVVNEGTIDGMIGQIITKLNQVDISNENPLPSCLTYSFTYLDESDLDENQLLAVGDQKTLKIRVEYLRDIEESELIAVDNQFDFTFGLKYVQADENAVDISDMHLIKFHTQGGSFVEDKRISDGEMIGELPTTTKNNVIFKGWYDASVGGNKVTSSTVVTQNMNLYAQWSENLCMAVKNTSDLMKETCNSASGKGCRVDGYAVGEDIIYGTLAEGSPQAGNAYDCIVHTDANGMKTERFYYLRQNGNNGVLISASILSHTNAGVLMPNTEQLVYADALESLPTTSQWDALPVTFTLTDSNNAVKPARLASVDDIASACGVAASASAVGALNACQYVLENTGFAGNTGRSCFWIQRVDADYYRVRGDERSIEIASNGATAKNSAKAVIEVPMSSIEVVTIEKHTITFHSNGGNNITSYEISHNHAIGTLPVPSMQGHTFEGWYTDDETFLNPVTSSTIVTGDMHLYAKWEAVNTTFPIVFSVAGACTFNGQSNGFITGSSCIGNDNTDYTNYKYINSQVQLYSNDNKGKDYEIGFTIDSYTPSDNVDKATFMNTKAEQSGYPGVVLRRNNSTDDLLIQSRRTSGANQEATYSYQDVTSVKFYRINGKIYYSVNNQAIDLESPFNTLESYNPSFTTPVWFGAAPTDSTATAAQRILTGTISKMYIRLGTYDSTSVYSARFEPENGDDPTTKLIIGGSKIGELPVPVKEGFNFVGWYTEQNGGVAINANAIIMQNVTYYARWSAS